MAEEQMTFEQLAEGIEVTYDNNPEFLNTAIDRAIQEIVTNVTRYQKKGELTLKISINPINDRKLNIAADIKLKIPVPSVPARVVWVDRRGRLVADDPAQDRLPGMDTDRVANIR